MKYYAVIMNDNVDHDLMIWKEPRTYGLTWESRLQKQCSEKVCKICNIKTITIILKTT